MDRRQFLIGTAAIAAAPRALAGGASPIALVTADLESHVVAFDLAARRVVERIPTLASPRSIETVGARRAVVAHSDIGAISILDGLRVRHVLRGFGEPRYAAAHPDGVHAFVTDAKRGDVLTLDVARGRVLARTPVGALARHLSLDADAGTLWVALGSKARELVVLDVSRPDRPRVAERVTPPFLAHDVAVAPDARHVWVSSGDRNELALYSPAAHVVRTVSADWPPQHVTFQLGRAYVTSGWSGTLNVHTLAGRHVARTVVPVGSYNVQDGAGRVVTAALGRGTLTICDAAGAVETERRLARSSHDACVVSL